jgi:hypothetical protein
MTGSRKALYRFFFNGILSLTVLVGFSSLILLIGCDGGSNSNGGGGNYVPTPPQPPSPPPDPAGYYDLSVETFGDGTILSDIGEIYCGNDCSGSYAEGTTVTLTAVADNGSSFRSWMGCDSVNGNACMVTVSSDKIVFPTFALNKLTYKSTTVILDDTTMRGALWFRMGISFKRY